jgi:hypothetical protein
MQYGRAIVYRQTVMGMYGELAYMLAVIIAALPMSVSWAAQAIRQNKRKMHAAYSAIHTVIALLVAPRTAGLHHRW